MLLIFGKRFRTLLHLSIDWYEKANKKYMKDYDKNKKSELVKYWNMHNFYVWAISEKLLPVKRF